MDNLRHAMAGALARTPAAGARFYQWRLTRAELAAELSRAGFEVLEVAAIHKRQGVLRALHHNLGLPYEWFISRALAAVIAPFVPGVVIAHMILAVAQKPQ